MEVSHGGMATLYLARMTGPETFQKLVAVKQIHDHLAKEPEFVDMFLDEARIAAKIEHPNVASIYDLGQAGGVYYIAMEYVHGENLRDIIRRSVQLRKMLPWAATAKIMAEAARGLHSAHELRNPEGELLGVVHRDVSPQNILVSYDGNTKVIDFGVAYAAERISHTQDGAVKGKLAYMSPEQVAGTGLDRRSDIFSLGIVLYEGLCFRRLFKKESSTATMMAVTRAEVPSIKAMRPSIPDGLEAIVRKALAPRPEDRFQTAAEFAQALEKLLVEQQQYVVQEDLAAVVQGLFGERKAQKDEEIRNALRRPAGGLPTRATVTFAEPSSTGFTAGTSFLRKTHAGNKALWVILIIVGVGLLGMAGFFVVTRPNEHPSHTPTAKGMPTHPPMGSQTKPNVSTQTRPRPDPRPDRPKLVQLHVAVHPENAKPVITVAGKKYEAASADIFVPQTDQPMTIMVEAPGFHPKKSIVVPVRDLSTTVTLTPIRQARAGRPRTARPRGVKDQWFKEPD